MKTTLSDIAARTGVTPATVQRAINGLPGVSEKKRGEIMRTAVMMGYKKGARINFRRIAVFLPIANSGNPYYPSYVWNGIEQYTESAVAGLEIIRLYYDQYNPESRINGLRELLEGMHGEFDGLVTTGAMYTGTTYILRDFKARGIPVVLVGEDQEGSRISSVSVQEGIAGSLAADLLVQFGAVKDHCKIIICGYFRGVNQYNNSQDFERRIRESGLHPDIIKIDNDRDPDMVRSSMKDALGGEASVSAAYSCSSRATVPMCMAVREMGLTGKVRTIGSDVFPESAELLRKGELDAVIYNRHPTISYKAIEALDSYLMGRHIPKDIIRVPPVIVTRGNTDYYIETDRL